MNRPSNVVLASAVGIIGGIVAIAALGCAFSKELTTDSLIYIAMIMFIAVLFFASAGFLYKDGHGNFAGCMIIELLNVIISAVFICMNVKGDYYFGIAFLAIAIVLVLLTLPSKTEKWMKLDRA